MTVQEEPERTQLPWDKFQEKVFKAVVEQDDNLVIEARAGAAKTTSLIEAVHRLAEAKGGSMLVTSFGKAQVEDLKRRNPPWTTDTHTLNSIGNTILRNNLGKLEVQEERVLNILDDLIDFPEGIATGREQGDLRYRVKLAVDLARNHLADQQEEYIALCEEFSIDTSSAPRIEEFLGKQLGCKPYEAFFTLIDKTLERLKEVDGVIDYTDQLWLPIVLGLPFDTYSYVFVDEAQDLNPVQVEMIRRSMHQESRAIFVGDSMQAIYRWRGAGIGMQPLVKEFGCKVLHLQYSYRCPRAVVRKAQEFVKDIQAAPGAPEGLVQSMPESALASRVRAGDVVLSRTNFAAISLFLRLLSAGVPCGFYKGSKMLGAQILRFIDRAKAKSIEELLDYTIKWAKSEAVKRASKGQSSEQVLDKLLCIKAVCEDAETVAEARSNAERLLNSAENARITLSTVHRFKGLERDRVFLLEQSFPVLSAFWAKYTDGERRGWAAGRADSVRRKNQEECNIRYVALTRARKELYLVEPDEGYASRQVEVARRAATTKTNGSPTNGSPTNGEAQGRNRWTAIVEEVFGTQGSKK